MLTTRQRILKRLFDIGVSFLGLSLTWPIILVGWLAASISTRANGLFVQKRVGQHGKLFNVYKLRSMRDIAGVTTTVTSDNDMRVTCVGRVLRKLKIDELPQLFNVLIGQMSLVGPRPDVPGYADKLKGDDQIVLSVKPGVTGPATIAFRHEEEILAGVDDPETYNIEVIWPEKVRLNREYVQNYTFGKDLKYLFQTVLSI